MNSNDGVIAARIDDGDAGHEHDDWQGVSGREGNTVTYPLRADRWWAKEGALDEGEDVGRCLGIRCNIWARAQRRREITHKLRGGGYPQRRLGGPDVAGYGGHWRCALWIPAGATLSS